MKARLIGCVMAALTMLAGVSAHAQVIDTEKAHGAIEGWLTLVDQGHFSESWQLAASMFKQRVDEPTWVKAVETVHSQMGGLKRRTLRSATATRTVPGAPDGEYVICVFDTAFENKAAAVETVTAVREGEVWRVTGYFVK